MTMPAKRGPGAVVDGGALVGHGRITRDLLAAEHPLGMHAIAPMIEAERTKPFDLRFASCSRGPRWEWKRHPR